MNAFVPMRNLPPAGVRLKGPAIIEEASTTVIVPPTARAHVDRAGNLIIDL